MVRQRLERELERELDFVEEGMKRRVIDIVRNLQLTLFRSYQQVEDANAKAEQEGTPSQGSPPPAYTEPLTASTLSPFTPVTSVGTVQSDSTSDPPQGFADFPDFGDLPDPLNIMGDSEYPYFGGEFDFGHFLGGPVVGVPEDMSGRFSDSGYGYVDGSEGTGSVGMSTPSLASVPEGSFQGVLNANVGHY